MDETSEELTALWQEPGFGEVFVDYEEATVTVYWKGTPPESVMSAIGLQPNGVEVFLEEAPYSNDELVAAGRRVLKAELNQRDKDVRLAGASPNRELSGIIVEVIAGTNLAQDERETAEGLEDIAGLPVTTTVVEGAPVPASRQNDSPPWQGGGAIATATGEDYCSIGFPVVKNGTGYLVSAAHCTGRGTGGTILDGVGDPIGIVVNRDAAPYDSLLVDPSDSPPPLARFSEDPGTPRLPIAAMSPMWVVLLARPSVRLYAPPVRSRVNIAICIYPIRALITIATIYRSAMGLERKSKGLA